MYLIENLTNYPKQKQTILIGDVTINMTLEYKPNQLGWFFTEIAFGDYVLNNVRACTSPCLLYQFKNLIPLGIAISTDQNEEPTLADDFSTGRSRIFILTKEEVDAYGAFLSE